MATEIADAYIALYTKMPGVKSDIAKHLGGSDVQSAVDKSGQGIGGKLMAGLGSVAKVGAVAVGGAIAGGIGTALVKGFSRLNTLDQATAKLTGLGHSAETVEQIMDNALASVRGTAFGMGDAATTAAGAIAAGIKPGAELERTLKAVADASTIAGTDMGSMGAIFNKVAASNKVQMDVINQLHDAGVPALALLAEQMGVTAEEASKMASKGEIDFATFQAAMEAGMGGAALESGNTFSGAMDNVMASLGRVGANLLSGIFPQMTDGFKGVITWLEPFEEGAKGIGAAVGDFVADAGPKFIAALQDIWNVGQNVVSFLKDNIAWIGPIAAAVAGAAAAYAAWSTALSIWRGVTMAATAVQVAFNAVMSANPIMLVIMAIAALVAGLVYFFTQTELGRQVWANFMSFIVSVWQYISTMAVAVFTAIGNFFASIWEWIVAQVTMRITMMQVIIATVLAAVSAVWSNIWNGIVSFFTGVWNNIISVVQTIQGAFSTVFNTVRGIIVGAFEGVVSTVKGIVNNIIGLVNGVINGINGLIGTVGGAIGVNVAIPNIPRLAEGGIVSARRGGIIANIGEGRYDEAVVPLTPQFKDALSGGSRAEIKQYITLTDQDPRLTARQMGRELLREMAGT